MLVQTKIQKWGNGLALRVGGLMRDIPHFKEGTVVEVEINSEGFIVKKAKSSSRSGFLSESALLAGMTAESAHADLLANPLDHEWGE